MGGDIWLEGSTSSGTVFTFTVRFCPPKILSGNVLLAELPLATGTIGSLYGNVLVAEDHPVNAEVAAAHLKSLGLTADIVEEGTAAVAAAARGGYDVILMDCEMPGMDGYEAARTIRKHEEIRGARPVPIIALTASAMAGDRQKALEAGMDDYVSKPFTRAQLFRALSAWLARSEPARPPA
jgi:CheY-like chemotaxis protein